MLVLKRIGLAGVGPYKEKAHLDITPGITVVYGKNKVGNNNANFVGKSLLVRSLEELIYDPAIRQDKKTGSRFVSFSSGKDKIRLESNDGSVEIFVNKEDVTQRKKAGTKEVLAKYWPISQEEFSTYVYLDALSAHPLVKGSGTARKAFFNSFFQLDSLDVEKKVFAKKLSELKKIAVARKELERALADVRRDLLTKTDRIALEEEIENLETATKKLMAKFDKVETYQRLLAFKKLAGKKLEQKARDIDEVKADIRQAKKNSAQLETYHDYTRDLARYKEETKGVDLRTSLAELRSAHKKYQQLLGSKEEPVPPKKPAKLKNPQIDIKATEIEIYKIKHQLSHAAKSSNGVCYACGQKVKNNPKDLKAALAELEDNLEKGEKYAAHLANTAAYDRKAATHKEAYARYLADKKQRIELKPAAQLYEKRKTLLPPDVVEKPSSYSGKTLRELEAELEIAVFHHEHQEEILLLAKGIEKVEFDPSLLQTKQDKLGKSKTSLALHAAVVTRAKKIKTRLTEIDEQLVEEEALSLILEGYNDKSVKKMVIEAISSRLAETVNQYAALVMPAYRFDFVWESNAIQILARRANGTISDVRKLSGAESMLFTIILVLALLVFVPKHKRVNTLILDEPTASFSETSTEIFLQLLPHITTVIPSVIVVTPKYLRIPDARCVTVVQDANGSKVVEGHPDEN
jgi:DNA repair exonuclease SbcCD ATPase subunit